MKFITLNQTLSVMLGCAVLLSCQSVKEHTVEINLVALNDFHGYIQASNYSYQDPNEPTKSMTMKAGGIATIGGVLNELRDDDPELIFVGVGDLVGASPTISNIWADEPALNALNVLKLDLSTLGNHEFDEGKKELMRQIQGGCDSTRPNNACQYYPEYHGSGFPYIAANVMNTENGSTLLSPYTIVERKGVKIAFIGAQVANVARLVSESAMQGLKVIDEAEGINHYIPELKAQGVNAIVAVIHEGGESDSTYNSCNQLSGKIVDIANRLDPAVDVILSAHTHQAYICKVGNVTITQGASYGHLLTHLSLKINAQTGSVDSVSANNIVVDPGRFKPDRQLLTLEEALVERSGNIINRPIAPIGAKLITKVRNVAGESAMGDLITDAQLAATQKMGAQIAFMNESGIRSQLSLSDNQEQVVYAQVMAVHPFKGSLQLMNITGKQLKAILEQQWLSDKAADFRPLQVSSSLQYQWSAQRPIGDRVLLDTIQVNGKVLQLDNVYRITVNAYLADGGSDFSLFTQGIDRIDTGIEDAEALINYLQTQAKMGKPAGRAEAEQRIQRIN